MKKLTVFLLAGCVLLSVPEQNFAQSIERNPSIKLGSGIGIPIGDVADGSDTIGLSLLPGVSVPLVGNTHALLEGHYTRIAPDDEVEQFLGPEVDADLELTGGNLELIASFGAVSRKSVWSWGYRICPSDRKRFGIWSERE